MKDKGNLRVKQVDNRDKELLNATPKAYNIDSQIRDMYMEEQISEVNRYPEPMDNSNQGKIDNIIMLLEGRTVREVAEILAKVYEWVSENARI